MIKRIRFLLVGLLTVGVLCVPGLAHASPQDFGIKEFTADYYLSRNNQKTSLLNVKETIVAEFPDYDQNHGIERAIPESYQNHTVSLEVRSVTNEQGTPYSYSTSSSNHNKVLRIGDADRYVHGLTTYKINYSLRNVINYQDQDELYWDVNGDQWSQTMDSVTARIHVPADLQPTLTGQLICFKGSYGQNTQDCAITSEKQADNSTIITTTAKDVSSNQTLTFDVGFKKGTFQQGPEVAAEKNKALLLILLVVCLTAIPPIVAFIICYRKWRQTGRDPKGRGVIIAEYIAPKNLNVLSSAFVLNQKLQSQAATAGIIELCIKGYLRINELKTKKLFGSKTDYEIEVVKDTGQVTAERQLLLDALFDGKIAPGAKSQIAEQKNKLYTTITKMSESLAAELTTKGYFANNPQKARKRFYFAGSTLLVLGFMTISVGFGVGLIIAGIIVFGFALIMPARTQLGVETRDYILGLKEYIKMAEAERLRYLQSPQGAEKRTIDPNDPKQQVKLFEDLLPYAILFGMEKDWAKQFKDLYTQPPSWYNGTSGTFNAIYLANSLSSFNNVNSAAFSAPSSSGSSGFGGGGFSGGGGGGGGGGGW